MLAIRQQTKAHQQVGAAGAIPLYFASNKLLPTKIRAFIDVVDAFE